MRRRLAGWFLISHAFAHSFAGMASWYVGRRWASAFFAIATLAYLVAGLGLLRAPAIRRWWKPAMVIATLASLHLFVWYRPPWSIAGMCIDVALFVAILGAWQETIDADIAVLDAVGADALRHPRWVAAGWTLGATALAYAVVVLALRPVALEWGTTSEERAASLAGDEVHPTDATYTIDHAITIHAPASSIWPWLVQLGQDRGGFYSYDWLERAVGDPVRNADRVHPEWQHRQSATPFCHAADLSGRTRRRARLAGRCAGARARHRTRELGDVRSPTDRFVHDTTHRADARHSASRRAVVLHGADHGVRVRAGPLHHGAQDASRHPRAFRGEGNMIATMALPDGRNLSGSGIARRVVVVLDGRETSDAVLAAACQRAPASSLRVLTLASPSFVGARGGDGSSTSWMADQREPIEAQIDRVLGGVSDVRLAVRSGSHPATIAAFAQAVDASLLVVGLGEPNVRGRLLSDEPAYHIARLSPMPVFGVSACGSTPRARVMVAMDGSVASRRAAALAREIAAPDALISLVYVRAPSARPLPASTLAAQAERLQRGHFGRVELIQLDGDPATELLSFANAHGVDLLAIGRSGETVRPRGVMGVVAARMIRCTQCSFVTASP